MSSYRNLVWRDAFALALLPASAVLVAANGPMPGSELARMAPQFAVHAHVHVHPQAQAVAQHQALARQLKAAQVQELRVAAAKARAAQQQAVAEVMALRSQQARSERPSS